MDKNYERQQLLANILSTISDATDMTEVEDGYDCGTVYTPHFRYEPSFEFTDDDIRIIRELADEFGEDFTIITE